MTDREALNKIWEIMFDNEAHNAIVDAKRPEAIRVMGEKLDDVQAALIEWNEHPSGGPSHPRRKERPSYIGVAPKHRE